MERCGGPADAADGSGVLPPSGGWLLAVVCLEAGVALSIRVPILFGQDPWPVYVRHEWISALPVVLAALVVPVAVFTAWGFASRQRKIQASASRTARLMETVLVTSREWLWAVGPDGCFTFSSPAGRDLVGYTPGELLGRHLSLVIDPADLQAAREARTAPDASWAGVVTICRHKDGSQVPIEVSGRPLRDGAGAVCGFEGTGRPLDAAAAQSVSADEVRSRIEIMLAGRAWVTAFQPIRSLDTGAVIGAEALTRFLDPHGISPETWFTEAASVGHGEELEILVLQTALHKATALPPHVYVAVSLSPQACLDPRLPPSSGSRPSRRSGSSSK